MQHISRELVTRERSRRSVDETGMTNEKKFDSRERDYVTRTRRPRPVENVPSYLNIEGPWPCVGRGNATWRSATADANGGRRNA
jgi:hypothetical protein